MDATKLQEIEARADESCSGDDREMMFDLVAEVRRLTAALATARREGAEEARRVPLKIYLVEGNVIAARSVREAAAIAEDQCGDVGPITGPLAGGTTVPVGTTTGEVVQIPVGKLLASGVQRGVVTRALPLDAPGGAT